MRNSNSASDKIGVIQMAQWKFKSCPRCDGDIFIDRDLYGWFEQCLQCGYAHYLMKTVQASQQAYIEEEKERRVTTLSKKLVAGDE